MVLKLNPNFTLRRILRSTEGLLCEPSIVIWWNISRTSFSNLSFPPPDTCQDSLLHYVLYLNIPEDVLYGVQSRKHLLMELCNKINAMRTDFMIWEAPEQCRGLQRLGLSDPLVDDSIVDRTILFKALLTIHSQSLSKESTMKRGRETLDLPVLLNNNSRLQINISQPQPYWKKARDRSCLSTFGK